MIGPVSKTPVLSVQWSNWSGDVNRQGGRTCSVRAVG